MSNVPIDIECALDETHINDMTIKSQVFQKPSKWISDGAHMYVELIPCELCEFHVIVVLNTSSTQQLLFQNDSSIGIAGD